MPGELNDTLISNYFIIKKEREKRTRKRMKLVLPTGGRDGKALKNFATSIKSDRFVGSCMMVAHFRLNPR